MEQDSTSSEHLSLERISALLDDPGDDPRATEHLEECERCEREQERLRRMRMALSALGGVAPPEDEWERIEPHLPDRETIEEWSDEDDDVLSVFRSGWVARVAAATLVFGVGLSAGLQLRDGGSPADESSSTRAASVVSESTGTTGGTVRERSGMRAEAGLTVADEGGPVSLQRSGDYLSAARSLERLVSGSADVDVEPIDDPVAAAEEMARLEALAEAAREALREQPADPTLNNFLFRVNERQETLRSRLGAAARLTSMDYR